MRVLLNRRLVLVGVGHSNLHLLKYLKQNPIAGLEIYVISDCFYTPYSGTLPGYIAEHFSFEDSHIDLIPFVRWSGCQFIYGSVRAIKPKKQTVLLQNGLEFFYDVLSVNVGSVPVLDIPFCANNTIFIKPIAIFIKKLEVVIKDILKKNAPYKLAVIGGGVVAVETALAINYRVRKELQKNIKALESLAIDIFTPEAQILTELTTKQRLPLLRILRKANIQIHTQKIISSINENNLVCDELELFQLDSALICTSAIAHNWVRESNLQKDKNGFFLVNSYLQTLDYSSIFASGDTASIINTKIPKAGVYAVRQGELLARNISNYLQKKKLVKYQPQKNFLKIISTGKPYAIFCWRGLVFKGYFFWWFKNKIDNRFLNKYRNFVIKNKKPHKDLNVSAASFSQVFSAYAQEFSPPVLKRYLEAVVHKKNSEKFHVIYKTKKQSLVQSVCYLKKCIPDFYFFGKLAVNHCLNDFFANGVAITNITPLISLQKAKENIMLDNLDKILLGIKSFCSSFSINIVGGSVLQKEEIETIGFALRGTIQKEAKGDDFYPNNLVITKPIGTGILLQALQENKIQGKWYKILLEHFLLSNKQAMELLELVPFFCVSIANSGLLQSLVENLPPNKKLILKSDKIPLLDGFLELENQVKKNSVQKENEQLFPKLKKMQTSFFDPQTCGPLVIATPENQTKSFIKKLHKEGYHHAAVIGSIIPETDQANKFICQ